MRFVLRHEYEDPTIETARDVADFATLEEAQDAMRVCHARQPEQLLRRSTIAQTHDSISTTSRFHTSRFIIRIDYADTHTPTAHSTYREE